jgi:putative Mg2+ transporter-C (MgtC) family protein
VWAARQQSVGDILRDEFAGFADGADALRLAVRLLVALAMGALLGYEREQTGKAAGLRTHMLVSLASALFTAAAVLAKMDEASVSRVIQGLAAGIGFIGGGAILKLTDARQVRGLTTAASVWLAAAVGVAAGLGRPLSATLGAVAGFLVLRLLGRLEFQVEGKAKGGGTVNPDKSGQERE